MDSKSFEPPMEYARSLVDQLRESYAINNVYQDDYNIKRGLRNADGTRTACARDVSCEGAAEEAAAQERQRRDHDENSRQDALLI